MKHRLIAFSFCFALLSLVGCGVRDAATSETAFAHSEYDPLHLVHYFDGATIRHCGDYPNELRWAVSTWGQALGRSYRFVEDCRDPMIRVYAFTTSEANRRCAQTNIQTAFADRERTYQRIVECMDYRALGEDFLKGMILHETGHLFGMGDTYGNRHKLSNIAYSRDVDTEQSIMRGSHGRELAAEDIVGIFELATSPRYRGDSGLKPYNRPNAWELIEALRPWAPKLDPNVTPEEYAGQIRWSALPLKLALCNSPKRCWLWVQEENELRRISLREDSPRVYDLLWNFRNTPNGSDFYVAPEQQQYGTPLDARDLGCFLDPGTEPGASDEYFCQAEFSTR